MFRTITFRTIVSALALLVVLAPAVEARTMYKARAYCSIRNVYGFSEFKPSRQAAFASAIDRCTARGGVPHCCAGTVTIVDQYTDGAAQVFDARSHCSITGATGRGSGQSVRVARARAIDACIAKGGVPKCCRNDVTVRP